MSFREREPETEIHATAIDRAVFRAMRFFIKENCDFDTPTMETLWLGRSATFSALLYGPEQLIDRATELDTSDDPLLIFARCRDWGNNGLMAFYQEASAKHPYQDALNEVQAPLTFLRTGVAGREFVINFITRHGLPEDNEQRLEDEPPLRGKDILQHEIRAGYRAAQWITGVSHALLVQQQIAATIEQATAARAQAIIESAKLEAATMIANTVALLRARGFSEDFIAQILREHA